MRRREFLATGAATVLTAGIGSRALAQRGGDMYGLIGKMTAVPGKRDELVTTLLVGTVDMPGCISYVVAKDAADADAIWITEVWDSKASHDGSLSLAGVKAAIAKARPLIARFDESFATVPVGGRGLAGAKRPEGGLPTSDRRDHASKA